jgi:hypothetical protein
LTRRETPPSCRHRSCAVVQHGQHLARALLHKGFGIGVAGGLGHRHRRGNRQRGHSHTGQAQRNRQFQSARNIDSSMTN